MSRHRAGDTARAPWQDGTREALEAAGLDPGWIRDLVLRALAEDLGPSWVDVTTAATVPADDERRAEVFLRKGGVVCGLLLLPVLLAEAAAQLGRDVPVVELVVPDGATAEAGDVVAEVTGCTRVLLVAQPTSLNLLRHLSGVATLVAGCRQELSDTGTTLLGTGTTTPGLRPLERYAVRCGGGVNGRSGLWDAAHVTVEHTSAAGTVTAALDAVRRRLPDIPVQVDVTTAVEAVEAVLAGARFLVCRDLTPEGVAEAVQRVRSATAEPVQIAVADVADLDAARRYAHTGVDHLYLDSLIQDAGRLDLGFALV